MKKEEKDKDQAKMNDEIKKEKSKKSDSGKKAAAEESPGQSVGKETEAEMIARQKQEYQDLWSRYLRLQAEFDNYRKRSLQEKADFIKFANQGFISELIGILDNFELSIKYADKKNDFKLMHQGVDMIIKQLHTLLKAKGLEKINTIGEKFDPHKHDALEIVEGQDIDFDTVIEELQPGYLLSGKILRPAKVKVAKPKKSSKEEENRRREKPEDNKEEKE